MQLKGFKVKIILVVFVVTLALFLGGQRLLHQQRVIAPLHQQFQGIGGVEQVEVSETRNGVRLVLSLGEVDSLQSVIEQVRVEAANTGIALQINIKDDANDELIKVYHEMHYALEEAIILGNFQEMAQVIREIAIANQVSHNLVVDSDYVYLQLSTGDGYLYQVISRGDAPKIRRGVS